MKTKLFLALVLFFIVSSCLSSADAAPDISIGKEQATPGQTISIPVDFTSDANSAHIQFDIFYDSSVLTPGTPAGGSASAIHVVDSNVISPGHLRFVVYSFSNAQLGSGRLVNLPISIASDAVPGVYPLTPIAVVISNPTGQPVTPTLLTDGSIEILEGSPSIPMVGPFGMIFLICLIIWTSIKALKHPDSLSYRILVLFVLANFTICSLGILPAMAAFPGDSDDDGDIDADDIRLTVGVILQRSAASGNPDCNQDRSVNVLDLPCQINNKKNSPPDLLLPEDQNIMAGNNFSLQLVATDPDPGDVLTFSLPTAPATMTCDPSTGNLQWNPLEADIGSHTIIARVTDKEGLSDSETFNIRVYPAGNAPPDLIPPGNREIMVGTNFLSTLFAIDPDPGDALTFSLPTAPPGMTCDPLTGNLSWNPLGADIGDHAVTARVADRAGQSDDENFNIRVYQSIPVGNENSAPDLSSIPDQNLTVGASLSITVTATDPDAGDTLTFSLPRGPVGMTINGSSGQIQWTPGADQIGMHDVTVMVTDSGGLSDAEAFLVTVKSQNSAPVANDDMFVARMGETLTVSAPGILENDTDSDSDPLEAVLVQEPGKGTLNLNPDGSYDYTPTAPQVIDNIQEVNQAMWLRPYKRATDMMAPYDFSFGADGDLNTSWLADRDVDSFTYYLNFDGELRPTVKELRLYGNRGDIADGHDIYSGRFRLLDENSVLLYESEELDLAPPDRDIVFPIPGGPVSDVYRVEFVFSEFDYKGNTEEPFPQPGFAELEVISDQEVLDVGKEWEYTSSLIEPDRLKVIMTPLVGDINGDAMPDIIFITYRSGSGIGILRAVSGNNGSEIFVADDISGPALEDDRLTDSTSLAMGDIDLDGYPEILGIYSRYIKAFQYDIDTGEIIREWTSDQIENPKDGGMSIADIDADGIPEIIVGSSKYLTVLNNDGSIRWQSQLYNNGGYDYKFPFAVDLDLDGTMEILSGQMAYTATGGMHWSPPDPALWDGLNALGNFDNDPYPEVVLVTSSFGTTRVYLLEHDGSKIWGPVNTDGKICPPTVADFDGDGLPEIGVSGKKFYQVIDTDGSVLWKRKIQDITSEHTGSSVFDFDGDGSAEVIFSDELDLIIFRGSDGAILFRTPIGSGTRFEYPVVADVDADGHAEIVVVRNQYEAEVHEKDGIHVFGGPDNDWVPTRKIWNQHAYHITNVNDDLTIPSPQQYNWLISGLNNFRTNVPYIDEDGSTDQFKYKASDGLLESNEATVFIDIQPANSVPVIVSAPKTNATAGFEYTSWAVAQDQDNDPLTYSLTNSPAGMSIDPLIGRINWAPENTDLGDHPVMVSVTDNKGGVAVQNYTLSVAEPVTVPDVIGETQADAEAQISASGLNSGNISQGFHISVPSGRVAHQSPPANSAVEPDSEVDLLLSLGPAPEDVDNDGDGFTENQGDCNDGDNTVYPGANDPSGDGIDQDCDGIDGNLPIDKIIIIPGSDTLLTGDSIEATAIAVFDDGTSQIITSLAAWNSLAPAATVDGTGHITAVNAGNAAIEASLKGVTGSAAFEIIEQISGDVTSPTAVISSPDDGTTITAPTDILGTATDANFLKYTLSIAPAGETDFTVIHTGTSAVADDVLGQFDPTLLLNDLYTLRLTVFDRGGNISIAEQSYQVDGNLKVGLFTLTFTDLQIPMSGLPITVTRTYDSRDKKNGDFGVGWRLGVQTMNLRANRVFGTGWQVYKGGLAYQLFPSAAHKVSIMLPGGRVEEFDMTISPNPSVIVPFSSVNASFKARPGTTGKLKCLDDTALLVIGNQPGEVTLTDFSSNTFNPKNFRYTALDGTQYVINKTEGVKSITEPNGNTLTFGPGGIVHSAGKSVLFERDQLGRITKLTDPIGNEQTYAYNGNGDLMSHTDAETNTTRFFYNYDHDLLRLEDPLGRPVARNEYDDTGRLIASMDALGNRIEYTHNIDTRQEVVKDRLNGISVYEYDETGNVVSETDPLGFTKTYTFDANGNTLSKTDPLGNVTTYTYNAGDLLLSEKNPLGNTTSYTYNQFGQVLTQTDPMGGIITSTYDGDGNRLTITDEEGNFKSFTYDGAGNLLTEKDPLGHVTSYSYDAFGNQTGTKNALGFITSFTYDDNGRMTGKSMMRTTSSGAETFTTEYQYDKTGKTVKVVDPLGNFIATGYDATGKKIYSEDKNGHRTSYAYDDAGNLTQTTYPDGTMETSTYDANGNRITQINKTGVLTSFTYDVLSRPVSSVFAGGTTTGTNYDGAGRVTAVTNALGNSILYEYDAAGNRTALTDPIGNIVHWTYDANGNTISTTDANGNTTAFEYDRTNRKVKTIFADGTSIQNTLDATGKVVTVTDQAGVSTFYEYDSLGRLTKVTDANSAVTSYSYDEVGNMLSSTDANGHVTRYNYDHLGRTIKKTLPLGMLETYAYDGNGNRIQTTDFNGQTTTYAYDANNRVISENFPEGNTVTYTYTDNGLRETVTDDQGTTSYLYDDLNRLTRVTHPDGHIISYTYDNVGNRSTMTTPSGTTTYTYDANNRLTAFTSPDGGVTSYAYYPTGSRADLIYPNGCVTTYSYDALNRLIHQETRRSDTSLISSYDYTLGSAGNRVQLLENTGRVVDYTYDNVYRLLEEDITDPVLGNQTISYTYDNVGNRLRKTDSSGMTLCTYDGNDRLLDEAGPAGNLTYMYDSNGNNISTISGSTSHLYAYDSKNRIISVNNGNSISYGYDADGNRVRSSVNGEITKFLVDKERQYAQVIDEMADDDSIIASYTYGDDLVSRNKASEISYFGYDGHGSTRHLIDLAENITGTYVYDAFGVVLNSSGITDNKYLYAGEQYDPDLDAYYLRARYYKQHTGRFMTTDPWHGELKDPVSLHKYLYARNNPVDYTDPSGEHTLLSIAVGTLIISILVNISVLTRSPKESIEDAGLYFIPTEQGPRRIEVGKQVREIIFEAAGANKPYSHWEEFKTIVGQFYDAVDLPDNYSIQCNDIATIIDNFDGTFHRDIGQTPLPSPNTSAYEYFYLKSYDWNAKHYSAILHLKGGSAPLIVLDPIGITLTGQFDNSDWGIKRYYIWTWDEYSSSILPLYGIK